MTQTIITNPQHLGLLTLGLYRKFLSTEVERGGSIEPHHLLLSLGLMMGFERRGAIVFSSVPVYPTVYYPVDSSNPKAAQRVLAKPRRTYTHTQKKGHECEKENNGKYEEWTEQGRG